MPVIIDGSSGITFPNSTTQASAGKVLQVVQGTLSTSTSTTSSSYVTSGVTATITPKFATSKIFILLSAQARSDANKWLQTALFKNGSYLNKINDGLHYVSGTTITTQLSYSFLDSPATTSATTYALYFNAQAGGTVSINIDNAVATIILMEIAG
ncbi:MAG: hypothetical protein ACOVLB_08150 [Candidatus Nanopelagicus sp.]